MTVSCNGCILYIIYFFTTHSNDCTAMINVVVCYLYINCNFHFCMYLNDEKLLLCTVVYIA